MDSALSDPHNGSSEAGTPANGTTRPPSTPEGIALAYGSLLLMALLPIFFGALRSVRCARGKSSSDMPETITSRDAARFPIIASCTLLGLYLFFKLFSQEYINLLLSMYFFVLGILALSHTISPFMNKFFPANFPNRQYQLLFTQGSGENKEGQCCPLPLKYVSLFSFSNMGLPKKRVLKEKLNSFFFFFFFLRQFLWPWFIAQLCHHLDMGIWMFVTPSVK
ncbi:histocompatibility 13 (predicted), isoform CRA_e [Rattus norvegicus]|uniref:Histocompatibility 13 (Predicted), isoform CRA_e n=1 Tax=Rattus norvegicus TaxID=10116 RepID=A6KHQ1_RAT|nr:histocompatibility 13 (predicted), isoform CRA_e [Rattus norvegicus]